MLSFFARKIMVAGGFLLVIMVLASRALAQRDAPYGAQDGIQVPEIDLGSALSGITLLASGVLLLADKLRTKK